MTSHDDRMTNGPLGADQTAREDDPMSTHDHWANQPYEPDRYGDDTLGRSGDALDRPLSRPKGPSWGTIALGLICLLVAGGAFWIEWADLTLDWTRSGPLTLVGLGLVLVLVGLAALLRRSDDEDPELR